MRNNYWESGTHYQFLGQRGQTAFWWHFKWMCYIDLSVDKNQSWIIEIWKNKNNQLNTSMHSSVTNSVWKKWKKHLLSENKSFNKFFKINIVFTDKKSVRVNFCNFHYLYSKTVSTHIVEITEIHSHDIFDKNFVKITLFTKLVMH